MSAPMSMSPHREQIAQAIFSHAVMIDSGVNYGGLSCACGERFSPESKAHREREIKPWMEYYRHVADAVLIAMSL